MNTGFGDRDGLLLHRLVNSDLVLNIHLVELIDTANTVISKHESSSLDAKFACLGILQNRSSETGCTRGFSTCVDATREE